MRTRRRDYSVDNECVGAGELLCLEFPVRKRPKVKNSTPKKCTDKSFPESDSIAPSSSRRSEFISDDSSCISGQQREISMASHALSQAITIQSETQPLPHVTVKRIEEEPHRTSLNESARRKSPSVAPDKFNLRLIHDTSHNLSIIYAFMNALACDDLKRRFSGSDDLDDISKIVHFIDKPLHKQFLYRINRKAAMRTLRKKIMDHLSAGEELPSYLLPEALMAEEEKQSIRWQHIFATSIVEDGSCICIKSIAEYLHVRRMADANFRYTLRFLETNPVLRPGDPFSNIVGRAYVLCGYRATADDYPDQMYAAIEEAERTEVVCRTAQLREHLNPTETKAWNDAMAIIQRFNHLLEEPPKTKKKKKTEENSNNSTTDCCIPVVDESNLKTDDHFQKDGVDMEKATIEAVEGDDPKNWRAQLVSAKGVVEQLRDWLVREHGGRPLHPAARGDSPMSWAYKQYREFAEQDLQEPGTKIAHSVAVVVGHNQQLWLLDSRLSEILPLTPRHLVNSLAYVENTWVFGINSTPNMSSHDAS